MKLTFEHLTCFEKYFSTYSIGKNVLGKNSSYNFFPIPKNVMFLETKNVLSNKSTSSVLLTTKFNYCFFYDIIKKFQQKV